MSSRKDCATTASVHPVMERALAAVNPDTSPAAASAPPYDEARLIEAREDLATILEDWRAGR